jgi:hypothetical protein
LQTVKDFATMLPAGSVVTLVHGMVH